MMGVLLCVLVQCVDVDVSMRIGALVLMRIVLIKYLHSELDACCLHFDYTSKSMRKKLIFGFFAFSNKKRGAEKRTREQRGEEIGW